MYTIIQTAKLNGLDPEAYLRDVIGRVADHPINRIEKLLPWNWTPLASSDLRPTAACLIRSRALLNDGSAAELRF